MSGSRNSASGCQYVLLLRAVNTPVLNGRCSRVPILSSFFLTMESFVHQISCRTWPLKARKVRASRPFLPPFLDFSCSDSTVYAQALHKLVTSCYLKPSTVLSHISPRDKRISYEAEEKAKIPGFPTAKELRQAREAAAGRLKREEDEAEKVGLVGRPQRTFRRENGELMWSVIAETQESGALKTLQGRRRFTEHCHLLTFQQRVKVSDDNVVDVT